MQLAPRSFPTVLRHLRVGVGSTPCASTSRTYAASNGTPTDLPKPDVRAIADLAQLSVTDDDVKDWEPKINDIIDWFGQLRDVDVSNVPPRVRAGGEENRLRADVASVFDERGALLELAPEREGPYVKIPRIATGADEEATTSTSKAPMSDLPPVSSLDIRVGKITEIKKHPDADSLYVESVDVGEEQPRTIVSGLVKFVPVDSLLDTSVIVLCNLKPRNMRGVKSHGMLLCASDESHENVEPLRPPSGASVGERVYFGEEKEQAEPEVPNKIQKKKIWEGIQPALKTGEDLVAGIGGKSMNTSAGAVTASTLAKARIS
ncbi:hypothetical protein BSKO_06074 [Bryopsis sp. KO-2023]|nr:hypothetical protein BSKO_06074 [Bryopsis sp. KO-2023]